VDCSKVVTHALSHTSDGRLAVAPARFTHRTLRPPSPSLPPSNAAAEVSHGTVRAILTRATASLNGNEPQAAEEESTASDDIAR
jgi:hypothetical protein